MLIEIADGVYADTDNLSQKDYYYFKKAREIGKDGFARRILTGELTSEEIENNEKYLPLMGG